MQLHGAHGRPGYVFSGGFFDQFQSRCRQIRRPQFSEFTELWPLLGAVPLAYPLSKSQDRRLCGVYFFLRPAMLANTKVSAKIWGRSLKQLKDLDCWPHRKAQKDNYIKCVSSRLFSAADATSSDSRANVRPGVRRFRCYAVVTAPVGSPSHLVYSQWPSAFAFCPKAPFSCISQLTSHLRYYLLMPVYISLGPFQPLA